ncbi:MAG: type II secretion system F family protein, partial [Defluviitaleaceae bacterium]|nr:type II secretion system F family protein [Defluviitaleaceae bacterium]
LLVSGNDLVYAVEISKRVAGNRVMDARLQTALERVLRGTPLSTALDGIVDEMLVNMIKLGEDTGQLPLTVSRCADYLQKELDMQISRLNRLVEPAVTLVLGGILAFVMLAIMTPTFQMAHVL